MRTAPLTLTLALAVLAGGLARADDTVVEPGTGHAFPAVQSVGGESYVLVGVGLRKKFIIKVYAMALYAEQTKGKAAHAGGVGSPQSFFAAKPFAKMGVLHFVYNVGAEKIRDAFKDSLPEALADPAVKPLAEAFMALFDRDMKKGEEMKLYTTVDGQVSVDIAGVKKNGPKDPRLATAVWNIWLGSHPISGDMKKSLVEKLDALK